MKLGSLLNVWVQLHYPLVDVNEGDIVCVVNALGNPVIGIVKIDHNKIKVAQTKADGTLSRGQEVLSKRHEVWSQQRSASPVMKQLRKL